MGLDYGINNKLGKISLEESHQILLRAHIYGITTLDTAETYGNAHQVIGDFHRLNPKVKFKVITKIPDNTVFDDVEQKIKKYCDWRVVWCDAACAWLGRGGRLSTGRGVATGAHHLYLDSPTFLGARLVP